MNYVLCIVGLCSRTKCSSQGLRGLMRTGLTTGPSMSRLYTIGIRISRLWCTNLSKLPGVTLAWTSTTGPWVASKRVKTHKCRQKCRIFTNEFISPSVFTTRIAKHSAETKSEQSLKNVSALFTPSIWSQHKSLKVARKSTQQVPPKFCWSSKNWMTR